MSRRFWAALAFAALPAAPLVAAPLSFHPQVVGGAYARVPAGFKPRANNSAVVGAVGGSGSEAIVAFMAMPDEPATTHPLVVLSPQPDGRLVNVTAERFGSAVPHFATASRLIVRDFDGDGRADLFVAGGGHDAAPWPGEASGLWLRTPAGNFTDASARLSSPVAFAHWATSADFNGDGRPDVYVGTVYGQTQVAPYVLTATTSGDYSLSRKLPAIVLDVRYATFPAAEALDVDNDGIPDLVLGTADPSKSPSLVLFNDGTGDFTKRAPAALPAGLYGSNTLNVQLLAHDVDGDGLVDLIANQTQVQPGYAGAGLQVLINNGSGGFIDRTSTWIAGAATTAGHHIGVLETMDLDGDGRLDFYTKFIGGAQGAGDIAFAWVRDAAGKFQPVDTRVTGGIVPSLFIDVNGDGRPEAVQLWRDDSTAEFKYALFFNTTRMPAFTLPSSHLDFGGQSARTTSMQRMVQLDNTGTAPLNVSGIAVAGPFSATHDCQSVPPGASCSVRVAFTPPGSGPFEGTLTISSNALRSATVRTSGIGERSLVTHYYQSILRRSPEAGGKAYWESEAGRLSGLGAGVNEVWYAMAMSFYASDEYVRAGRGDADYVRDLYATFFNREPDAGGLAYWVGQIASGMPREVVLAGFLFSPEYQEFTRAIFGSVQVRSEVDTVVDFYRGLLSRLPDTGGFEYWLSRFRAAQCTGADAVLREVDDISAAYANSGEYASRQRSNAQFVGDMYNSFLRRGGDLDGVKYWIGQLDDGHRSREQVRRAFLASPEFSRRVEAMLAETCRR